MTFKELAKRCGWFISVGDEVAIAEYEAQARTKVIQDCAIFVEGAAKRVLHEGSRDWGLSVAHRLLREICAECNGKGSILYESTAPWIAESGEPTPCPRCAK